MHSIAKVLASALLVAAATVSASLAAAPRKLPSDGPRFNVSGKLDWSQFKGKVVIVDFWNHH